MNNTARLAEIDRLLKDVPTFECKPGCSACCGPIALSKLELKRIVDRTGINPKLLLTSFRLKTGCINCPLLKDGKCSVYDIRPAICRIYGASEHPRLKCGIVPGPDKPLTKEETNRLVDQVLRLGHGYAEPMERSAEIFLKPFGLNVGTTCESR